MFDQSVGIIGVGRLGSDVAFALAEQDLCDIVLYDLETERAEYLASDLSDTSFGHVYNRRVRWVPRLSDLTECSVILVAAGAHLGPNDEASKVYAKNREIAAAMAEAFAGSSNIFIVATEPIDLMTSELRRLLQLPPSRVLGTGGMVDAFVARYVIGEILEMSPDYIRTHVIGPHGVGTQIAWSFTNVNGIPVVAIADKEQRAAIEREVSENLKARLDRLNQSNIRYAPAMACVELIRSIVKDDRRVLSVTTEVTDVFGLSEVAISVPCVIGRFGADRVVLPEIDETVVKIIRAAGEETKAMRTGGAA